MNTAGIKGAGSIQSEEGTDAQNKNLLLEHFQTYSSFFVMVFKTYVIEEAVPSYMTHNQHQLVEKRRLNFTLIV